MENWKEKYDALNAEFSKFKKDYEEFIHLAAHDLDSPLRKLSTFIDRLHSVNKNLKDENSNLYLSRIHHIAEEMRAIVDALYRLSLVITEKPVFNHCDLQKIAKQTISSLQEEINEKNISVEAYDLPVIWGNEAQLALLFKNLVDNSIKFSRKDTKAKLTIHAEQLTEKEKFSLDLNSQTSYYRILIRDNGIGFRQEQATNIFQPFVRLHGKSEIPGSGLGLSVCKKIVERHNGSIYAEGLENSGACFVLILPQNPR